MSEKRMQATARVRLTIEVPADGLYGPGWTIEDITAAVRRDVIALFQSSRGAEKLHQMFAHGQLRVIDKAIVHITINEGT